MSEGYPFLPLNRDGLVDRVANSLVGAILSGAMRPGDRLAESHIARQMDLSRAPVREALRLLESSGLVEYRTNRGFFVRAISATSVSDLYDLRILIETAAIRRLTDTNPDALPVLRAQVAELHRLAGTGADMMAHVDADMAFHRLICEGSGNQRFLQVFDQIANETKLGLMLIGRLYDDPHRMAETHEPIVEAIAAGDADAAAAAIDYHIRVAKDMVTDHILNQQEAAE
ncbi:GntR family transcriptional regulator [Primorskyibacter flagellatus]|uniref:GntR family transcriptional regulator n=1 Tax=Primorskyibacter flagellatus TaxID=1387277 RepID=A0A917ECQ6_9RHOB|nr:GntR family transcriptional regulator [Primorskyibacter flagellatus]GGE24653.1 GntR family transcriptional regulator [Primorskyibacter flagellatus]